MNISPVFLKLCGPDFDVESAGVKMGNLNGPQIYDHVQ